MPHFFQILLNTRPSAYSNPPGSNLSRSASTPTGQQSAPAANWTGKTPKTEMPPSPAPTAILTGASKPPSRPGSLPSTHVLEEKKLPSGSADSPKVGGTSPAAGDILTNPASAPPAMQDSNGGDNVGNMTAVNTGGKRPYSAGKLLSTIAALHCSYCIIIFLFVKVGDSLDPGRPLSYLDVSALSQQSGSSGAGMPPTSSLGSDPLQKMAQMASDTLPYEPLTVIKKYKNGTKI